MTSETTVPSRENNTLPIPNTAEAKHRLYLSHASSETVPQGRLLTDLSPKKILRALHIFFARGTLARKKLPIKLNVEHYRSPDYVYDTSSMEAVAERLKKIPYTKEGMKWLYEYNGELCVQFAGVHYCNYDFDEFIKRVNISRTADCFRDILGINTEVLQHDKKNRVVLQIERMAALAQPRYSAFLGKDELDVYKLEFQEYGKDEVRNWMKAVCSPNGSAAIDDSYIAVSRRPNNKGTKIEFVTIQQFPLPRIMVFLQLGRWPWLREFLTRMAYKSFWNATYQAMIDRYHGKVV